MSLLHISYISYHQRQLPPRMYPLIFPDTPRLKDSRIGFFSLLSHYHILQTVPSPKDVHSALRFHNQFPCIKVTCSSHFSVSVGCTTGFSFRHYLLSPSSVLPLGCARNLDPEILRVVQVVFQCRCFLLSLSFTSNQRQGHVNLLKETSLDPVTCILGTSRSACLGSGRRLSASFIYPLTI